MVCMKGAVNVMKEAEALYWNNIYADKKQAAPKYDDWLDRHTALLEQSKDTSIVDLGCGSGGNTLYLIERGYRVVACDLSNEALESVLSHIPSATVRQFNMLQGIPFETASAKVIIADLSLHYFTWRETEDIVNELRRVLQPGGALLCRLNSIHDVEYGAGQGREVEPHLFEQDGRTKRFFDEEQIRRLFTEWSIDWLQETTLHRYDKPKQCWELAAVFAG